MRQARLFGIGDVRLAEVETPRPSAGESLVRVEAVGVCGSDLHWYLEGGIGAARLGKPLVLGHEFAGTVEGGPLNGVRVAVDPAIPCRSCARCSVGDGNLCTKALFAGHAAHDGAMCDYVVWPTHLLHPVPETISIEAAALLEPLGVAVHAFDLAHVEIGRSAVVIGCGPIGLLLVQLARAAGIDPVVAVEPLDHRREQAERFGASAVVRTGDELLDALGPEGVDVAFEVAGRDSTVDLAVRSARSGGRVVVVGIPAEDSTTFTSSVARRKGLSILLAQRMRDVFPRAISLVERRAVDLDSLVSARFPLERASDAFELAARRTGLKTLVMP